jgi:hypothetical protein
MMTILLYAVLTILILTTLLVVRTAMFSWRDRAVARADNPPLAAGRSGRA